MIEKQYVIAYRSLVDGSWNPVGQIRSGFEDAKTILKARKLESGLDLHIFCVLPIKEDDSND